MLADLSSEQQPMTHRNLKELGARLRWHASCGADSLAVASARSTQSLGMQPHVFDSLP